MREMLRLALYYLARPLSLRLRQLEQFQNLCGVADRGEWVAQFVRQHGQELILASVSFFERFLHPLALGDVRHRACDQHGGSALVVKLLTPVENINVSAVGAAKSVFIIPVAVAAPQELFKTRPDSIHVFGMNAVVPILQ